MKVVKFMNALLSEVHQNSMLYGTADKDDNSGEYVSLAEYQELLSESIKNTECAMACMTKLTELLKRWSEIGPDLFDLIEEGDMGNPDTSPELIQLIQDTQEVVG